MATSNAAAASPADADAGASATVSATPSTTVPTHQPWSMWSEMQRLSREMDRLVSRAQHDPFFHWDTLTKPFHTLGERIHGLVSDNTNNNADMPPTTTTTTTAMQPSFASCPIRCNIKETDTEIQVTAELPGVNKDDTVVEVKGDLLRISAKSKAEKEEKNEKYHRIERSYGSFERTLRLPEAAVKEQIRAEQKDGLLTVTIPKREAKSQEQRIPIA